jgi:hypothetical protein
VRGVWALEGRSHPPRNPVREGVIPSVPDKNKLQVFTDKQVTLARTCATCDYGNFPRPQASWGECGLHSYTHAKHEAARALPAHVSFVCPKYQPAKNLSGLRELGTYADILQKSGSPL